MTTATPNGPDLYRSGRFAEALQAFHEQIVQEPSNLWLQLWVAVTLQALGRHHDALQALESLPTDGDVGLERAAKLPAFRLAAARQAQIHYDFTTARSIALELGNAEALALAERLAMVQGDVQASLQCRERIRALHLASDEEAVRGSVGQEPLRAMRLEFAASPMALAELARVAALDPLARSRAIAALIEAEPWSTAAAYGLLLALRQAGRLGLQQPGTTESAAAAAAVPIPPLVHGLGPEAACASWLTHHPAWELRPIVFDLEAIQADPELPALVKEACASVNHPAVRTDLLRLAALARHGGIAPDHGVACKAPIDAWLDGVQLLLIQDIWGGLGPEIWAAAPNDPFIAELLELGCRYVLEGQGYARDDLVGPYLISGCFARHFGAEPQGVRVVSIHETHAHLTVGAAASGAFTRLFNHPYRLKALARLG